MQRIFFPLFVLLFSFNRTNAQIIPLFKSLVCTKSDTTIALQYYKSVDGILLSKIDSFDLFLAKTKYELDSNYFYKIKFTSFNGKLDIAICYQSDYHDYVMLTNSLGFEKIKSKLKPFAFFFYKNRLMLCTIYRENINSTTGAKALLKNLICENVNESEKKLILHQPKGYTVQGKPVKGYYLD
jgi:hypothetical protein